MSLSHGTNDVTVKKESSNDIFQAVPPKSGGNTPKTEGDTDGWQEIPLKCCTKEETNDIRFHMMKFQSTKNVDIVNDFTKPVRLHRKDPRNIQFHLTRQEIDRRKREEEDKKSEENGQDDTNANGMDMSQVAPDGGARKHKKSLFKRKTRQLNLMDEDKRKLRYEEFYPWVIEDYDGKNVFVGNYEAGSSDAQHVLFVFDKDGFKMIPAEKVYRFTPRNKYATLTLEEAEAKMEKNSSVPRWLMKHMEELSTGGESSDLRFRNSGPDSGGGAPAPPVSRRRLKTVTGGASLNDRDSDHDDLDFDEEFADDEEAPIMDGDDEENKLSEKKIKKEMLKAAHFDNQSDADDDLDDLFETETRKVDKEGKKLKKVLNKAEGGVYDSDDEDNLNPYLSKSDLESDDESEPEIMVKNEPNDAMPTDTAPTRSIFAHNVGNGVVIVKGPKEFLSGFPKGSWNPSGRKLPTLVEATTKLKEVSPKPQSEQRNSPSPSQTQSNIGDLNSPGDDNNLVTVSEVLALVRDNPLTTKELLVKLKGKVSAHRDNKQRIISIVKQNLKLVDGKLVSREA
jgi:transcription initiation factor TFIIF subunit alpha